VSVHKRHVLLINPRVPGGNVWVPIGLGWLAAYLRKHQIEVKIVDGNLHNLDASTLGCLLSDYHPHVVGIGAMSVQCADALRMGTLIKNIDRIVKLVYGGVHFSFVPEDGLRNGDISCIGESEKTLAQICMGEELGATEGIVYREDSRIMRTVNRELMSDLDEIPFPAYDLLEMDKYQDAFITGEKAISIMTGRGCPYNCIFCASPGIWKRRVRFHSLDYVMSHIRFLVKTYGLKNLRIMDDTFTVSRERTLDFCDRLQKEGIKLNLTCLTNVKNADEELFIQMRKAGFSIVAFGIESGNELVRRSINKPSTNEQIRAAIEKAKRAGLDTELLFMIGNIGESVESIWDSINLAKGLNPPESNSRLGVCYNWFQFATPFPGSEFHKVASRHGRVVTLDYTKYTHDEPVFVPKGLDFKRMVELRDFALRETNSWKEANFFLRLYRKVRNTLSLMSAKYGRR